MNKVNCKEPLPVLMSLTTILGPLFMNNLFKFFTTGKDHIHFPGAPFLLGAIFMVGSISSSHG